MQINFISHKKKIGENLLLFFGNLSEPLGAKQKFQFILRLIRNIIIISTVEMWTLSLWEILHFEMNF